MTALAALLTTAGWLHTGRVFHWLFAVGGPLKERAIRGGIWLLMSEALSRGAGLIKAVVLARLLFPEDFGLMGIALLVIKWLEYFTQTGFTGALISQRGDIRSYLDTAFSCQVVRSVLLTAVMFAMAPLASDFFNTPAAVSVIRAVAVATLLRGLLNPAVVHLRRDLDFRRDMVWKSTGVLAGLAVAVVAALASPTVWALVLSLVVAQAVETAMSYWVWPYRPRLEFDRVKARELAGFGKWIFGWNIVSFLGLNLDSAIVGRLLGAAALGSYQMAQQVALYPILNLGTHLQSVLFPTFARLERKAALRQAYVRMLTLVVLAVLPVGFLGSWFAAPIVLFALGERWATIAPTVAVLVWAACLTTLTGVSNALCLGMRRPQRPMVSSLVKVAVMASAVVPLLREHGITGTAWALTAAEAVVAAWAVASALRLVGAGVQDLAAILRGPALAALPLLAAAGVTFAAGSGVSAAAGGSAIAMSCAVLIRVAYGQLRGERRPS